MSITLTRENVVKAIEEAVEAKGRAYVYPLLPEGADEYGEFEYAICTYVRDGQPSCIVGHALASLGVPVEILAGLDAPPGGTGAYRALTGLAKDRVIEYRAEDWEFITGFLLEAQIHQDGGDSWGDALDKARSYVGLVTA